MKEHRRSERLPTVTYNKNHDRLIRQRMDAEKHGLSDCDLLCGKDGTIVLRNFSIEEAQHHFRMINVRILIQCPTCGSHNLLAAAVQKNAEGEIITFPSE